LNHRLVINRISRAVETTFFRLKRSSSGCVRLNVTSRFLSLSRLLCRCCMRGTSRRPIAYSARLPARHVGVVQSVHDVVTGYCMCAASAAALHLQQSCLPGRHWRHMRTDGAHYESTPSRTHIHSYSHSFDIQTAIEQDAVASCCALWVEVTTVN